ncbi:hypothetical protein EMCRGX_G004944 [Ephydatia muelleri]|eukprot:Em0007g843a
MGELVTGIGDEVILFSALVVLSMLIIVLWSRVRRVQSHAPAATATPPTPPLQHDRAPNDASAHLPTSTPPSGEREGRDLRNRFLSHAQRMAETGTPADGTFHIRLMIQNESIAARVRPDDTLDVLRRTYFQQELSQNRRVIFIRQGLILEDAAKTLRGWGLVNDSVLHVHVGSPQQGEGLGRRGTEEEDALDLSMLFIPLFGLILGLTWACFFYWPQYFSLLTKIFLTVLSLAYVLLTYVTFYV